ncbi:TetR/AcrR family transcriptional regulator [Enterococcus pallens]|uniref:HTH tetR-type domain-containing protein n=1 Tax=Enterococcus pallens ATCC BAA-351 TaxID=1158607 RepID=R2SGS9_9ENTE|nr:TetR/AcrR family transcriptional regulator [Enterococcus pallens]EOH94480.1 hypothetical protein UAU_02215 [Enterococcus pallens ATCC BAA-351]EOU24359.1 hypothetical protein I588_00346 [Enterococcus pallens ATCC BAA-351]OJG76913.1 hypothetical protein RV10_GL003160 [Enterococcus pallens]
MPKFNDSERLIINDLLLENGEQLFTAFGLKKVTVSDLAKSANISKGSFYAFYPSKEHLYMTINFSMQQAIFAEMNDELAKHRSMETEKLTLYIFKWMFEKVKEYPLLLNMDNETIQHLLRRLPKKFMDAHTLDDAKMIDNLKKYGIVFRSETVVIAKVVQGIFSCTKLFMNDTDGDKVLTILLEGLVNQLV